ncbi:carboxypeptidase-like regulatory domain-containing protein [Thermaerobacillus caldiproteolyticus]|uniref:carboxypeptidase-like regulatory domain-containing protein n=1 Tax=Thermaerobacillus caldiproteolyticus TaxID=247480 RepID=UPI00188C3E6D|nr:carboxypeptidase-like regulatory domain-containing protein [Anoxybacillus caldiproteolyticus]QPA31115.1 carboxypeptidase regulatory-like domain-containing protein [Anoxybacillus caldiproteolyticus]
MKKIIVSLLVVFLLPLIGIFSSANASENTDMSKVTFNGSLEKKNQKKDYKNPEGNIKVLENKTRPVLKKNLAAAKSNNSVSSNAAIQALNDSPNNAAGIEIGNIYTDYITKDGQQKWYHFTNETSGKLTVILQTVQSSSVDYDLHLFKLNEDTMTLDEVANSTYNAGLNEQLSLIGEEGTYYMVVNSVSGSDPDSPFAFLVERSSSYDQYEPDDNIYQASAYMNNIYQNKTIDNSYDMDWVILQVDTEKTLTVNLNNPTSIDYQLDIFDLSLNPLAGLEDNTNYSIVFPAGTYLLRVQSRSWDFDPNQEYTLDIREKAGKATSVVVSNIDTNDNVEGYINYGYGYKWRIQNFMNIEGQLLDENGLSVPYANVEARITTALNNEVYYASSTTDRNGYFTISFTSIPPAVGNFSYANYASYHYFDIIPLVFLSNGQILNSNEDSLYHFAYSIYRPH